MNSYTYFFYAPVIVEILIAACLGMAILAARPEASKEATGRPAQAHTGD
jgi:hypothetical protein